MAAYPRARFYSAVELALVGLLFVLGAMRAGGAWGAEPALPDAEPRLAKTDLWERLDALEQVRQGKATAGRETLEGLLKTESRPLVRLRALQALAAREDASGQQTLLDALQDKDPMVRQGAAQALGNLVASSTVAKALDGAVRADAAPEVQQAALSSIGLSEGPEAVAALDWASKHRDRELRGQAAHSLRRHKGKASGDILKRLEQDPDEEVRRRAGRGAPEAPKPAKKPAKGKAGKPPAKGGGKGP